MLLSKRAAKVTACVVTAAAVTGVVGVDQLTSPATASVEGPKPYDRPVAPQLKVPDGNERTAQLDATGVQTYTCTDGTWSLLEPAATLFRHGDRRRRPAALHSRGPVWVSTTDGSAVNAAAVPGAKAPRPDAVPELLLKSTDNRGTGLFGSVSYIQRLNTRGGVPPTGSCAAGTQTAVPYKATYVFYQPVEP
ncbi:DUF3455 domain-containing protein [Streptomyces sp. NPDC101110]|uniref:DUF3455 domain-containing protein n=1 Tax=unclassified Streptomyces TaxID=2593676 RepID=UPI0037F52C04